MSYTFQNVFPTLAIIEDENPQYEPVLLNDGDQEATGAPGTVNKPFHASIDGRTGPVTSSFRATNRLLRSHGGFSAYFRGFFCLFAHNIATGMLQGLFSGPLPGPLAAFAVLLASLALVQLSTAWVHIVITPRSSLHFWRRLPPFRRTFDATARPVALFWLAVQVANMGPFALAWGLGLRVPDARPGEPTTVPAYDASDAWKTSVVAIVAIAASLLLVVPAHVVLIRVQASLLPESEDTIIPFDRSFGGAVAPAVVDGKGYATMSQAWRTFTPSAWRRLIVLYVKTIIINIAGLLAIALVISPQVYVVIKHTTIKEPTDGSA